MASVMTYQSGQFVEGKNFCILTYENATGTRRELVWNQTVLRVPRSIASREMCASPEEIRPTSENLLEHTLYLVGNEKYDDEQFPFHVPNTGDRIFIPITANRAVQIATELVEREWDRKPDPMRFFYKSKASAIDTFYNLIWHNGLGVELVTVTAEMRDEHIAVFDVEDTPYMATALDEPSYMITGEQVAKQIGVEFEVTHGWASLDPDLIQAVDTFANEMKLKLYKKELKGYYGWNDESFAKEIGRKLKEKVEQVMVHALSAEDRAKKFVDIGNFAMMLWNLELQQLKEEENVS